MKCRRVALSLLILLLPALLLRAEEGMFQPYKLPPEVFAKMKALGFTLSEKDLFSPSGSLSQAVVSLGGGTGSFVSPQGLILTNHHVAFGAAQRQSSLKLNIIHDGFIASTMAEEIPAPGYKAWILKDVLDVTARVLKGVTPKTPPRLCSLKIEKNIKALVKEYEGKGQEYEVRVTSFYGGLSYYLFKSLVLRDLRIVYIPSRNIGEFGGETDNWMWPRHTGDFSFLRAYVGPDGHPADYSKENLPYKPEKFLPFSAKDIDSGDFALVMGFPGRTSRYLTAEEIRFMVEKSYPERIRMMKNWIDILEAESQADPEAAIKNASILKGIYNGYKNSQGQYEGFLRAGVLARREAEQKEFLTALEGDPLGKKKYKPAIEGLLKLIEENQRAGQKAMVMGLLQRSSRFLSLALQLNQWSVEKTKKDMARKPGYMERDIPNMKAGLELAQRGLHVATDKKSFAYFLGEALALPEGQKIAALERVVQDKSPEGVARFVNNLYDHSQLGNVEYRLRLFSLNRSALLAEKDPFIDLAGELQREFDAAEAEGEVLAGKMMLLKPLYMEALLKTRKGPIFPDANSTLRLNFGVLEGYSPKDAVLYSSQTTLKGVLEKDTGKEPFEVPEKIKLVYRNHNTEGYTDPELKDVPVNFLTTNDSTGGNSGSPIIDKEGNLMGLLFDGNYESVVSDYYFLPEITRTISVDARYILFVADKVDKAENVLKELMVIR